MFRSASDECASANIRILVCSHSNALECITICLLVWLNLLQCPAVSVLLVWQGSRWGVDQMIKINTILPSVQVTYKFLRQNEEVCLRSYIALTSSVKVCSFGHPLISRKNVNLCWPPIQATAQDLCQSTHVWARTHMRTRARAHTHTHTHTCTHTKRIWH